jgi:hypothetical protein
MKLSKTQQELLNAMKAGVTVRYVSGIDAYWYRVDTGTPCSAAAASLIRKGYATATVFNTRSNGRNLVLKEQT